MNTEYRLSEKDAELLISLRHELHRRAELSGAEHRTKELLMKFLRDHTEFDVKDRGAWFYAFRPAASSPAASSPKVLSSSAPPIAFRADMDALPIPESCGLPSVQELSGEQMRKSDSMPTRELQKHVIRHPGIWIIALSCSFVYITQYGLSNWGVLFLQKAKGFSLTQAVWIIGFSESFGIAGTVLSGWLSDKVFHGNRALPVALSGAVCLAALCAFMFLGGSAVMNIVYVGVFSLAIGVVYCIVGGLMALDIVPRKATGAALGIVGISSYVAAGLQDIVSGFLIQGGTDGVDYNFTAVALFWIAACVVSVVLPVVAWRHLRQKIV